MHRSSLTLGTSKVTPQVTTCRVVPAGPVTSPPRVILAAEVAISENFVVSSCDMEVLLDISTAFADAALALQRLQDAERTAVAS